jgi:maltoporin|tara:strand:+ start:4297 stop:5418 length:1122 start_codon:yes stop_codon:yes gene_type:complete
MALSMKNKRFIFALFVALTLTCSSWSAIASFELDTTGYFRHGFLIGVDNGNTMNCNSMLNAFAKSRYGNECEGFLEFQLHPSYETDEFTLLGVIGWDFLDLPGQDPYLLSADEQFLQVRFASGWGLWTGKRSYQRREAHIYDYKYYHYRGEGVGGYYDVTEDIRVTGSHFFSDTQGSKINSTDLRVLISDLFEYLDSSSLEIITTYGNDTDHGIHRAFGIVFTTRVDSELTYLFAIKKASGPLAHHEFSQPRGVNPTTNGIQVVNELVYDANLWSLGVTNIYEKRESGTLVSETQQWFGTALRIMNYLSSEITLVQEISFDTLELKDKYTARHRKYSLGLQYSKNKTFYDRPVYRFSSRSLMSMTHTRFPPLA